MIFMPSCNLLVGQQISSKKKSINVRERRESKDKGGYYFDILLSAIIEFQSNDFAIFST